MTVEDVRTLIAPEIAALRAKGIARLYVFGSVARGEAGPGSDVDLLFEAMPGRFVGLYDRIGLRERFAERLGAPVDLVSVDNLHPAAAARAVGERIRLL